MKNVEVVELEKIENSPSERYGHTTCIVEGNLYLFGGCSLDGRHFHNDLHTLDLAKMEWIDHTSDESIDGRHFHTCTNDPKTGKLIFFGGKSNGYKDDVFTYDIGNRKFEILEPRFKNKKLSSCMNDGVRPPTPRYGHSACFYSGRIFIFGGYDKNGFTKNDLYCFNFQRNMWKRFVIARIPFRYHHSGFCLNGNYFIIGGITKTYKPLNDVYRLDLTNLSNEEEEEEEEEDDHGVEAFKLSIDNPIASYGHKCFYNYENKIYMYGGRDEKTEFKHLLRLEEQGKKGNLYWEIERDVNIDETKLNLSYGSLDLHQNKYLLFFGGQYRGEKKKKKIIISSKKEEEEEYEEEEMDDDIESEKIPVDCVWIIFSFLQEKDIVMVASTSKIWIFSIAAKSDRFWTDRYKKAFKVTKINEFSKKKVKRQTTSFSKFMMLREEERRLPKIGILAKRPAGSKPVKIYGMENLKMVTIGDGAVGKTCLLISKANGAFPDDYVPTVFDNYNETILYKEKCHVTLGFWDTAGEEDYDRLRPLSYPETNVFLLCFSLVDPTSLENVYTKWHPEVQEHEPGVPIVLCGTKLDLREDPQIIRELAERDEVPVKTADGMKCAVTLKLDAYFETSAKTLEGVDDCFTGVIAVGIGDVKEEDREKHKDKCGVM